LWRNHNEQNTRRLNFQMEELMSSGRRVACERTSTRCGEKALINRQFMNGLREVLGQDVLYPEGDSDMKMKEKFYKPLSIE
jgi:hypothetical protein